MTRLSLLKLLYLQRHNPVTPLLQWNTFDAAETAAVLGAVQGVIADGHAVNEGHEQSFRLRITGPGCAYIESNPYEPPDPSNLPQ
jgi:hypothetical protein